MPPQINDTRTNLHKYYVTVAYNDVLSSSVFFCGVNPGDELELITQLLLKVYPVGQRVWGQKAYAPQLFFKMLLMCQWHSYRIRSLSTTYRIRRVHGIFAV